MLQQSEKEPRPWEMEQNLTIPREHVFGTCQEVQDSGYFNVFLQELQEGGHRAQKQHRAGGQGSWVLVQDAGPTQHRFPSLNISFLVCKLKWSVDMSAKALFCSDLLCYVKRITWVIHLRLAPLRGWGLPPLLVLAVA